MNKKLSWMKTDIVCEDGSSPEDPANGQLQPARGLPVIEMELRVLQDQFACSTMHYAVEFGRRLTEAKTSLAHGQWGGWLKKMGYTKSTANNLMRIFQEYGQTDFQALGNLSYTKALQLLALPDAEERDRFAAEHDVENMSTRELNEALKARDAALAEAAEAKAVADGLRLDTEHMQADLDEQKRVYEKNITSATADIELAKLRAKQWQEACENARKDATAARKAAAAASAEHTRLLQELEELRNRPVDVAVEVDTEAVEAARKAAIDEMTGKVDAAKAAENQAEEKRRTAEDALAAVQKELEELKAQGPKSRKLTQKEKDALTADAVEKARAEDRDRLQALEKQLAVADGDTAAFKIHFEAWQDSHKKMMACLGRIDGKDQEKAGKLWSAVKTILEQMGAR